ncbi:MAG: hypothetical protein E7I50_26475, partial [Klebsiella oxytoca]|nr:hypothetical protein [Klebsiella oxytoca]
KPNAAAVVPAIPPAQILKNFLRLTSIVPLHAGCLFIAGVEINSNNPVLFASNQCPDPMPP